MLKSAADKFGIVLGVDDGRFQHADGFRGDAPPTKNLIVEIGFAGIAESHLRERFGLRGGMGEPDLVGVAGAIERSGFESACGKIAAEDDDGAGFLQGVFFDEPVTYAKHESKARGKSEKGESAEDREDPEQLA